MVHMPEELLNKDVKLKGTKKDLKEWVRKTIPVKGDRILWGQKLTGETRRKRKRSPARQEGDDEGGNEEEPAGEEEERRDEDQVEDEVEGEREEREIREEISRGIIQQVNIFKQKLMKKRKRDRKDQEKLKKRKERSKGTGPGRRVTGSLPRAGVEPPHLRKGGSLSPEYTGGTSPGEPLIWRSNPPLILVSCMVMGLRPPAHPIGKERKQEILWCQGLGVRSRTARKMRTWPRSGVG